jgi:hypothetical protein
MRTIRTMTAAVLAAWFTATTAQAAPPVKCLVKVNDGKVAAGNAKLLARKIADAAPGDTIHIGNRCTGNFTITKQLTLTGDLSADDVFLIGGGGGSVLTITADADVTITKLLVNGGNAFVGGGIYNDGTLTLGAGVLVLGNNEGGGVYNAGTLLMTDDALIATNFSFGSGGGLYNEGTAILGDTASIRGNTASASPFSLVGGGIYNAGTLTLRGQASVRENFIVGAGGGIFNEGTLTLEDSASVTDNTATNEGGAIDNGANGVVIVDPAWSGSTCDPANSPNDFDAYSGGAPCN